MRPTKLSSFGSLASTAPNSIMPLRMSAANSPPSGRRATPTMANFSGNSPACSRWKSAGISLRLVRSPEAPNITRVPASGIVSLPWGTWERSSGRTLICIVVMPGSPPAPFKRHADSLQPTAGSAHRPHCSWITHDRTRRQTPSTALPLSLGPATGIESMGICSPRGSRQGEFGDCMPEASCDIGLIGLAVMGQNLVLNMNDHGFKVAVFNRTVSKVDDFLANEAKGTQVAGAHSVEEFVGLLKKPRRVMLMVKAGDSVDQTIEHVLPYLEKGDIVIDGGNSLFTDSDRRTKDLAATGILFIGTGVSGGEEGARRGPSIMPGGNPAAWPHVKDIFQAIAAKVEDGTP